MRLALLSALAGPPGTSGTSPGERLAFRRFAGKSVLAHQLDCTAHLGCERVLCLASALGPDLGAAKAHAERLGLRFDIVDSPQRLQAQVAAQDEVVLIADGILPDQRLLIENLSSGSAVLAFPDELAVDQGFERLDATRAWSGALRTRGDTVARLADLPPDCDIASSLLRLALQTGARVVELDPAPLVEGAWQRRVDRQSAQAKEWRWVMRQVRPASFAAPGRALADRIGLRWAHDAAGGRWRHAPHGVVLVAGALAAAAGFGGWPVLGLGALLLASSAFAVAAVFDRVAALGAPPRKAGPGAAIGGLLGDALLVALISMQVMTVPRWLGLVLPLMLIALLWLGEAIGGPRTRALFGDRILLIAAFIAPAYMGWNTIMVAALLVLALGWLLWTVRGPRKQLTAD